VSNAQDATVIELADRLWRARVDRVAIPPITADRPDLTVRDAYAIQAHNIHRRVAMGAVTRGFRLGRTSRARQYVHEVEEPDFGVLLDAMFIPEGEDVPLDPFLQPRVMATMGFVMCDDLAGPGVTVADALTSVAGVLPAIEVADSRIAEWQVKVVDTIADNSSAGRVILGGRITPVTAVDLRLVGMLLYRNGVPLESAAGAAALGNPAGCVAWVANELAITGRGGLRRGDIVLTGPLHRLVPVRPGDNFRAEFAHLGAVTIQFADRGAA
jgi:2-keto-4-pentenoate hydratase